MQLHVDDDGFVRAPAGVVYRVLTDVARWPDFWPRTRVTPRDGDEADVAVGGLRPLRLRVTAHGWRHDAGFRLTLGGGLDGEAEFWLEPGWGGTVVHHLCTATGARRDGATYRRWVRTGLWGLRDHLHASDPAGTGGRP